VEARALEVRQDGQGHSIIVLDRLIDNQHEGELRHRPQNGHERRIVAHGCYVTERSIEAS
jgi:hypothetical protein